MATLFRNLSALVFDSFTTTQRDALNAQERMLIFNTTTNQFEVSLSGVWFGLLSLDEGGQISVGQHGELGSDLHPEYAQVAVPENITASWLVQSGGRIAAVAGDPPAGEVVGQVKTTTGAPSHSASQGTTCWVAPDSKMYVNNNGSTGWTKQATAPIEGADVGLPLIGSPTFTHVEHLNTVFHSTGWISGGAVTDAGGATVDVAAGAGAIRASDSPTAQLLFFDWPASSGLAITADNIRYIGVEYNSGTPQVVVRTTLNFDTTTDFILATVVNEGGTLHIQNSPWKIGDHAGAMIARARGTMPIARDKVVGGLIFSETGTRNVVVTAGALWHGLTKFTIPAIDTTPTGDTFTTYSAGGQEATGVAAWPNEQYDNSGTLTNMTNNRWANLWWYLELDGELVMVYGTNQYVTEAQADQESPPSVLPDRLQVHGTIAARFIFQKSASTAAEILTAFAVQFNTLGVTAHDNLAGLTTDNHHDEAHTLTSHSTTAHSELSDAPTDAHHVEDHDHDSDPTQKLLAANTHESPSSDTHHAASHARSSHSGVEEIRTLVFTFPDEDLAAAVYIPRPSWILLDDHPAPTSEANQRFTATCDTVGAGTNTIVLESTTTNPFTGSPSWTVQATLALGTSKHAQTSAFTSDWVWDPATEYLRVRCSAVNATAPKEAIAYFEWE